MSTAVLSGSWKEEANSHCLHAHSPIPLTLQAVRAAILRLHGHCKGPTAPPGLEQAMGTFIGAAVLVESC